jgi:hypothetical protein
MDTTLTDQRRTEVVRRCCGHTAALGAPYVLGVTGRTFGCGIAQCGLSKETNLRSGGTVGPDGRVAPELYFLLSLNLLSGRCCFDRLPKNAATNWVKTTVNRTWRKDLPQQ